MLGWIIIIYWGDFIRNFFIFVAIIVIINIAIYKTQIGYDINKIYDKDTHISQSNDIEVNSSFDENNDIVAFSREQGSGSREGFIENIKLNDDTYNLFNDLIYEDVIVLTNNRDIVKGVNTSKYALGYVPYSNLENYDNVMSVNGVSPTDNNIKNKIYGLDTTLSLVTGFKLADEQQDFINFVKSKEGQDIIEKYAVSLDGQKEHFISNNSKGKIILEGSQSVGNIMEEIIQEYNKYNPNVEFKINCSNSTVGLSSVDSGICDMAMISRTLTEEEKKKFYVLEIGYDAIIIIKNKHNTAKDINIQQLNDIYRGKTVSWRDVIAN